MATEEIKLLQWNEEWLQKDNNEPDEEEWDPEDHDLEFKCTQVFFQQGTSLFTATTNERESALATMDLSTLERTRIPLSEVYPPNEEKYTVAPDPLPEGVYIQRPDFTHYRSTGDQSWLADRLLKNVRVYEIVKADPHPNFAQYHGVIVEDGYVTGIALKEHDMVLGDRVDQGLVSMKDGFDYYTGIEGAIRHLHKHGLTHGDVHTYNVMIDGPTAVLVNFDDSKMLDTPIGRDGTAAMWVTEGLQREAAVKDFEGLKEVKSAVNYLNWKWDTAV